MVFVLFKTGLVYYLYFLKIKLVLVLIYLFYSSKSTSVLCVLLQNKGLEWFMHHKKFNSGYSEKMD